MRRVLMLARHFPPIGGPGVHRTLGSVRHLESHGYQPIVVTARGTKLCRPSEAVLDILPQPQRGAFSKEDGQPVVDAAGNRIG